MYPQLYQYPLEQKSFTSYGKIMEADATVLNPGGGYGREGVFDS
jgi:hypothetical protein